MKIAPALVQQAIYLHGSLISDTGLFVDRVAKTNPAQHKRKKKIGMRQDTLPRGTSNLVERLAAFSAYGWHHERHMMVVTRFPRGYPSCYPLRLSTWKGACRIPLGTNELGGPRSF
jgi:hypothetical protein